MYPAWTRRCLTRRALEAAPPGNAVLGAIFRRANMRAFSDMHGTAACLVAGLG
jgi:hypothetical protein